MTPAEHRLMQQMFARYQVQFQALIWLLNSKRIVTAGDDGSTRLVISIDDLREFDRLVQQEEQGQYGSIAKCLADYTDGAAKLGLNIRSSTPKKWLQSLQSLFQKFFRS